jgi:hypothetical protein
MGQNSHSHQRADYSSYGVSGSVKAKGLSPRFGGHGFREYGVAQRAADASAEPGNHPSEKDQRPVVSKRKQGL